MFYLSTYLQWFESYRWKTAEQDNKSAFTVPKGPFRVNSQEDQKFTYDWGAKATKVPHFSSYFISCQVWPKKSYKPFDILQYNFLRSKIIVSATILPNMSENYQETVARCENFRKFVARARNNQLWGAMIFDL